MKDFLRKYEEIVKGVGITILVIVVLIGLFFVSENTRDTSLDKSPTSTPESKEEANPLLEEGQELDEEKMKTMEEITYEDFQKYLKKKKTTTVIMLGYDSCYWCQEQKPILESLMYEKDIDVKYLDINELESEQYEELVSLHEELENLGTPTFISVKNKKVVKVSPNAKTKTELLEMLVDMGIIKE